MLEAFRLMALAAPTLAPVLIVGEAGTERETVAHCLHRQSALADGPWTSLHCGEFSEQQLSQRLFGEESVSPSGSVARRPGCFEQSRGGTLFLDDITALSLPLQLRLLRALQIPRIERRRHGDARASEIRILTGALRDPREALLTNAFREDLFLRLSVVTLRLPRLLDRGEDLLLLTAQFATALPRRSHGATQGVTGISREAFKVLAAYPWPGNVRELRQLVEHAALAAHTDTLELADLPAEFRLAAAARPSVSTHPLPTLSDLEARHIALVLRETRGVIHRAAEILGIHRNTLTRKMRQYRIPNPADTLR
jgi:two-component system response regulator HydG